MSAFRKKPIVIDAVQWPGNSFKSTPPEWLVAALYKEPGTPGFLMRLDNDLFIETLEGRMRAAPGDWIIRGIKGEIYPCKPDIFAATYEPADAAPSSTSAEPQNDVDAWFDGAEGLLQATSAEDVRRDAEKVHVTDCPNCGASVVADCVEGK